MGSLVLFAEGTLAGTDRASLAPAHTDDVIYNGSIVSTDATGLAAVSLTDGSAIRLDAATAVEFRGGTQPTMTQPTMTQPTMTEPIVTEPIVTQPTVALSGGRSWHRVAEAPRQAGNTSEPEQTVQTIVGGFSATASTFSLDCREPNSCILIVYSGSVTVTPLAGDPVTVTAFQQLTVDDSGVVGDPGIYPVDAMLADEWTGINRALDDKESAGFTIDVTNPSVKAAARLQGSWTIDSTVVDSYQPGLPPGTKTHREWEFGSMDCADSCQLTLTRDFGDQGKVADRSYEETVTYSAGSFELIRVEDSDCTANDDGRVLMENAFTNTSDYVLVAATVELRQGLPTVTTLAGTHTGTSTEAPDAYLANCALGVGSAMPVVSEVVGSLLTSAALPAMQTAPIALPAPAEPAAENAVDPVAAPMAIPRPVLGSSPDAPSVLSSLRTVQQVNLAPWAVAGSIGLVLILMLIVGYPAQLLNSTISTNYDRIMGWTAPFTRRWARLRPPAPPADAGAVDGDVAVARPGVPHWLAVTLGIIAASVIAAFIDPGFGFNAGSARLFVSLAISFVVRSLFAWLLVLWVVKRLGLAPKPTVRFRYASLLIVVAAVMFSRFTAFEPGIVFGAVFGLALGLTLAKAHDARLTLVGLGYAAGVSVACWLAYSWLVPVMGPQPGFVGRFFLETLSGFTVGGFSSLPLSLLPMAILSGGKLFAWRKPVWAACYGVGLLVFILVLMPLPTSWGTVDTPFTLWLSLYIGFGVFAVLFWAYFRLSTPSPATSGPVTAASSRAAARPEESDDITVDADQ
ncbi:hypothetical protein [Homoserinimonas sp. OAct 916]|uniref:hypothetical protein n=1 Tax=Homoserinimonas sp. OAct 916 TaxID=2211450 RepID=UPI000DBEAA9C|nr:hypothetical protein [Homoserinimonas sp. OAct 916]